MSDNSDLSFANKQPFSSISQNSSVNIEGSLDEYNDQKRAKVEPKDGSSVSELRTSLKNALQILDRIQTDKENEIDSNFERKLNILNSSQENSNLSKSEQLSKPKNYKIIRKKKFVPYRRTNENSQDRTEVSLFLETADKIENEKNNNKPSNLNFENLQFITRDIDLISDENQNDVDLDELAKSLGVRLEVSEKDEADTNLVDVSDLASNDSQRNPLLLSDRMKNLGNLISVTEGDLDHLTKTESDVNNT